MKNCYGCPTAQTDKCLTCRTNENLDVAIRHGASFSADAASAIVPARDTSGTGAAIPEACDGCPVVDFAFALLDLDPVDLLLAVHRMRGGSLDGAGKWLAEVSAALSPWVWAGGMSRQNVHARLKGLKDPRLAQAARVATRKTQKI